VLIGLVWFSALTVNSHAVASSNLSITSSTNVFLASTNNTLMLEIVNVGDYLKELDVALTVPSSLVLFGVICYSESLFGSSLA